MHCGLENVRTVRVGTHAERGVTSDLKAAPRYMHALYTARVSANYSISVSNSVTKTEDLFSCRVLF